MTISIPEVPLAGVVIDIVSSTAGMAIVLTGLLAGTLRALAVLSSSSPERVEWMTAAGLMGGAVFAAFCLLLDMVLR